MNDLNVRTGRCDRWECCLTEEQQRDLYRWARTPITIGEGENAVIRYPNESEAKAYIAGEYGSDKVPSHASWHRFLHRAKANAFIDRISGMSEDMDALAAAHSIKDETVIEALKIYGMKCIEDGEEKCGVPILSAATAFRDRMQKQRELDLKARAQQTKDEQLKLAREKFEAAERRLQAVQDAVKSAKSSKGGLTEETLKRIEEAAGLL